MATKRILIVDDEGYQWRCEDVRFLIKEAGMQYDIALTLEEVKEKLFTSQETYDAIMLDHHFPETEEKRATGKEGQLLLDMMEERDCRIPVMMYGIMLQKPHYDFVYDWMCAWDILKLKRFLKNL